MSILYYLFNIRRCDITHKLIRVCYSIYIKNYRGIALGSLFCKLFDRSYIIIDQLFALKTDDLMFVL